MKYTLIFEINNINLFDFLNFITSYLIYTIFSIKIISITILTAIIFLSAKIGKEILDVIAKTVGIAAGNSIVYNN